ncbi:MAG: SAM-dependent methyltransferase [Lachnospiraceae bacterium]|nr:SAM-dependent methyltransferase [Lachnospiraceae bacterium]
MEEQLEKLLQETVDEGLYQIILSNPRDKNGAFKIKIRPVMVKGRLLFQQTTYEGKQVFHENLDQTAVIRHIEVVLERDFRQCEVAHQGCRAVILVSKKGKMTISKKKIGSTEKEAEAGRTVKLAHNRKKQYILQEGIPVPFLVDLGVQTKEGKIVHARYDKFKQINRFLEFIEDILPTLSKENTVHIIDFGCGKSYLTFAMYYYLHDLRSYDVEITGLDLKEDVIVNCNALSQKYGYVKLHFIKGDIAEYEEESTVDMVVTLHACDTATDYALAKAVEWGAKVILSVPCCQHEINRQIHNEALSPLLKYGIIKERLSALVTDALRANLLEAAGYETNILEFIDMEHTPKNLLIRAVRKSCGDGNKQQRVRQEADEVMRLLHVDPTLNRLI